MHDTRTALGQTVDMEREIISHSADRLEEKGFKVVLLEHEKKKPAFKGWNEFPLSRVDRRSWLRRRLFGIGIHMTGGVQAVDLDSVDLQWAKERGIESPMICRTARGFHLYFRGTLEKTLKFDGGDIKATGFCVAAPTVINGHRYEFVNGIVKASELPPLPQSALDLVKQAEPQPLRKTLDLPTDKKLDGARKWVRRIIAVQGERGDAACFRAAMKLCSVVRDPAQALRELAAWNDECARPPFSEKELMHKVASAMKYLDGRR